MSQTVVTRFAPSPTGHLHVGGARTALFNWALARRLGGRFLLRIEDTDRARSSEAASRGILEDLAWLELVWDEGPVWEADGTSFGGDPREVGPFRQSERLDRYEASWSQLLERDFVYPAFETAEELDALRRTAQAEKRGFRYRRGADYARDVALARMREEPHVLRFRMTVAPVRVVDAILGEVVFGEEHLDDFIVRKRDGLPTYHFAVVVDDAAMGVTHVLRGQEHLNNTPRQVILQQALGFPEPVYLHVPLIFNPDGSKMSKRDKDKAARRAFQGAPVPLRAAVEDRFEPGALAAWLKDKRSQLDPELLTRLAAGLGLELPNIEVEDFRRAGFLPEVLCNFLALLGWNPGLKDEAGKDLEHFDREFITQRFDPARIGKSNAKFDRPKLEAFNQDAIATLAPGEFVERWGEWCRRYDPDAWERLGKRGRRARFAAAMQIRSKTLADPTRREGPGGFALVADDEVDYDPAAVEKFLVRDGGAARLRELGAQLRRLPAFEPEAIEATVRAYCDAEAIGFGKAAQPLRVALAGRPVTPPLGDTVAILGSEATLRRIERCLATFENDLD